MVSSLLARPEYAVVFYIAFIAVHWRDVLRGLRRSNHSNADRHDRNSRWVIAATGTAGLGVGIWLAYAIPSLATPWRPRVVFGLGIVVMVTGGALRQYAVCTLDRYFTNYVMIHTEQAVIESGPYRWVRHPSYAGTVLSFIGIGIVVANWASIVAIVLGALIGHGYRIRVEERVLRDELGEDYEQYTDRTPYRLVPYFW